VRSGTCRRFGNVVNNSRECAPIQKGPVPKEFNSFALQWTPCSRRHSVALRSNAVLSAAPGTINVKRWGTVLINI